MQSNPRWRELAGLGQFEEKKAVLSLRFTPKDIEGVTASNAAEAINSQMPTPATIRKYHGPEVSKNVIMGMLAITNRWFGDDRCLSEEQVNLLADALFDDYYYMNLADYKVALNKGMRGEYGKIYGKLSPSDVMLWFSEYSAERFTASTQKSINEHRERLNESKRISAAGADAITKMLEHLEANQREIENALPETMKFTSIENYCRAHGMSAASVLKELQKEWRQDYDQLNPNMTWEHYAGFRYRQELIELNDKGRS